MKSTKLLAALLAAPAILVSCNKIEHETFTPYPSRTITTDASGANLSKREYTYSTSGETLTQKYYNWSGSEWNLVHDYAYTYEYGTNNMVKYYIATENGSPAIRYDYEYFTNLLVEYEKCTEYKGSETTVTERRFDYEISNNYVNVKYTYIPDEAEGEWIEYSKDKYERNDDGDISTIISYRVADGGYVEDLKAYYSYTNRLVSKMDVKKNINGTWVTKQTSEYSYDRHERMLSKTTVLYNLDVDPVTSTTTTESYYYPD